MKKHLILSRLRDACEKNIMPCTDKYGVPVSRNGKGQYDPLALFTQDKKKWSAIVGIDTQPNIQKVLDENHEFATYVGDHDWATICRIHDRLAEDVWDAKLFLQRVEAIL